MKRLSMESLDVPPTEVLAKAKRRRFTVEYKLGVVREADACRAPGEVGALLRREGLYSSHLTSWRAARDGGELGGKGTRPRGPKPDENKAHAAEVERLTREAERWKRRAERAEGLVDLQKKVAALLGMEPEMPEGRR
jgi:transposase-like protein